MPDGTWLNPMDPTAAEGGNMAGGQDAVREAVMRELRASIRERQMRGVATEMIRDWIDRREAVGEITQEEGAVARLIARHYTEAVWEAVYPAPIGS
jgi:N-methylhydantoinase B/oxoprolinase/acetone carboxylase alpha subunit